MAKLHVRKDDTVVVITGKDKGKKGKVLVAMPEAGRVVVEGVNIVSRHTKPRGQGNQGGILKKEAPIDASNVMYYDTKAKTVTKIGYEFKDGKKVRVSKKTGNVID